MFLKVKIEKTTCVKEDVERKKVRRPPASRRGAGRENARYGHP